MNVTVLGLGAIGSNLIDQLMSIAPENTYYGVDFDKVEQRNTITQLYNNAQVGMTKSRAMLTCLHLKHKKVNYVPIEKKIENTTDIIKCNPFFNVETDLLIDCFDNIASREISNNVLSNNTFHIGFSPKMHAEMYWKPSYVVPKEDDNSEDICENPLAKPFILFTVSLAAMVIQDFFSRKEKNNYVIFNKMQIQKI